MTELVYLKTRVAARCLITMVAIGGIAAWANTTLSACANAQTIPSQSEAIPVAPPNNSAEASSLNAADGSSEHAVDNKAKSGDWTKVLGLMKAREITIDSPRLTINLPDKGGVARVTVMSGQALTPLVQMMKKFAFKNVHLKDGTFVIRTPSGFTQTIYSVNATISGDKDSSVRTAKGRFKFRGEELSFELSTLKPSENTDGASVPINFILQGEKLNAQMAGSAKFKDGFEVDGKLRLSLPDIHFVSAWLGYPLSHGDGTTQLNADGAFTWHGSVLSFVDAEFSMGDSSANGAISLDLAGSRPRIDGTIALKSFDFNNKIVKSSVRGERKNGALTSEVKTRNNSALDASESLDLGYLNDFDADFRLSADLVHLDGFDAKDCALTLTLKSGNLFLGLVESKAFGGMARGEIELKNIGGASKTYLRANLEKVQMEKLSELFELPSLINGPAQIKLDFSGAGSQLSELKNSLSGEIKITMDGLVEISSKAGTLNVLPEDVQTLDWWTNLQTGTALKSVRNNWKFSEGQKGSGTIILIGEDFQITGQGKIDILEKTLSLNIDRKPVLKDRNSLDGETPSSDAPKSEQPVNPAPEFQDDSTNHVLIHGPFNKLLLTPVAPSETPRKNEKNVRPKKQGAVDTGLNQNKEDMAERG